MISSFGIDHGYEEVGKGFSQVVAGATQRASRSAAMRPYRGSLPKGGPETPSPVGFRRKAKQQKLDALMSPYKGGTQKSRSSLPLQAKIVTARLNRGK